MQICPSGSDVQGACVGATSKACASECDCNDLAIIGTMVCRKGKLTTGKLLPVGTCFQAEQI